VLLFEGVQQISLCPKPKHKTDICLHACRHANVHLNGSMRYLEVRHAGSGDVYVTGLDGRASVKNTETGNMFVFPAASENLPPVSFSLFYSCDKSNLERSKHLAGGYQNPMMSQLPVQFLLCKNTDCRSFLLLHPCRGQSYIGLTAPRSSLLWAFFWLLESLPHILMLLTVEWHLAF
jgi:hypothetical protein